jgi:hypothetical protein
MDTENLFAPFRSGLPAVTCRSKQLAGQRGVEDVSSIRGGDNDDAVDAEKPSILLLIERLLAFLRRE